MGDSEISITVLIPTNGGLHEPPQPNLWMSLSTDCQWEIVAWLTTRDILEGLAITARSQLKKLPEFVWRRIVLDPELVLLKHYCGSLWADRIINTSSVALTMILREGFKSTMDRYSATTTSHLLLDEQQQQQQHQFVSWRELYGGISRIYAQQRRIDAYKTLSNDRHSRMALMCFFGWSIVVLWIIVASIAAAIRDSIPGRFQWGEESYVNCCSPIYNSDSDRWTCPNPSTLCRFFYLIPYFIPDDPSQPSHECNPGNTFVNGTTGTYETVTGDCFVHPLSASALWICAVTFSIGLPVAMIVTYFCYYKYRRPRFTLN